MGTVKACLIVGAFLALYPTPGYNCTKWVGFAGIALVWGRCRGWYFWLYGALLMLSALCAYDGRAAVLGLYSSYSWGLAQLAVIWCLSGFDWRGVRPGRIAEVLATCISLVALAQYASTSVWGIYPVPTWNNRLGAPFGSPVILGAVLAVLGPLLPRSRLVLPLWVLALLGTQSRGAILAGFGARAYLAMRRSRRPLPWLVAAALAAVVAVAWLRPANAISDSGRVMVWRAAWAAVKQRPWGGWGPENGIYAITPNRPADWLTAYSSPQHTQDHAHNAVLDAMVTSGLPGFPVFIAFAVGLWRDTRPGRGRAVLLALAGCSAFNPVFLPATAAAMLFSSPFRPVKSSCSVATVLAAVSLSAAIFSARMLLATADPSLPLSLRAVAGAIVGLL